MDKLNLSNLGEKLKTGGAQMGRAMSDKMKEILQGPTQESKMVDEATSEHLEEPNWGLNLRICALLNSQEFNGPEVLRSIKKKIGGKSVASQGLGLELLEACAMNCDKVFSEIASEKVLEEMVKMIENGQTVNENKRRAFGLIRAWGQNEDLKYLPVFRQTYLSLKSKLSSPPVLDDGNATFSMLESDTDQQPLSPSEGYPIPDVGFHSIAHNTIAFHGGNFSVEEKKEFLVITRNSIELLSTILNETESKAIKDDLTLSMLEKCKESQPVLQRIIQNTSDDEGMLFEALNLNDELQKVISKYEEIEAAVQSKQQSESSEATTSSISPTLFEIINDTKTNAPKGESDEIGVQATKSLPVGESSQMGDATKNITIGENSETVTTGGDGKSLG